MTDELFREDADLQACVARVTGVRDGALVLDRTVFYPTGGGQPGDTGTFKTASGDTISIVDTRKDEHTGAILHILAEGATPPAEGEEVEATVDWGRRHRHMRMHTCLHLICSLVDGHITGASVGAEKSRVDFDIPGTPPDKTELTEKLNALIDAAAPVKSRWITDAELDAMPDLVRTLNVAPPRGSGRVRLIEIEGIDLQPCGGTHVNTTGEIGRVRISKIENKGRNNRRVNVVFDE